MFNEMAEAADFILSNSLIDRPAEDYPPKTYLLATIEGEYDNGNSVYFVREVYVEVGVPISETGPLTAAVLNGIVDGSITGYPLDASEYILSHAWFYGALPPGAYFYAP